MLLTRFEYRPILVVGATGVVGRVAARHLLSRGHTIRILTRTPDSPVARAFAGAGATVIRGDLDDATSLDHAMVDIHGVLSAQWPRPTGDGLPCRRITALIAAARRADVQHLVHTSVTPGTRGTGTEENEKAVCNAGFPRWTILQPAAMMTEDASALACDAFDEPDRFHGRCVGVAIGEHPEVAIG